MLLSIVTGTYNRVNFLRNMVDSVRAQMFPGIGYEIVLVDGGSTDGTIAWAKEQPDILLIEQGRLLGAIPAFCAGARAAQGDYVVMANDDIEFHPYSLLSAIAYLEDTPSCGAVAFADNRVGGNYGVQVHPTRDASGKRGGTWYAQVGMFRRWLGDLAGWWGDQDAIMGQARTYGGDNFLSARIWEMGYTIDPVQGCVVKDLIPRDELRQINNEYGDRDSKLYYKRFNDGGAIFGHTPVAPPERDVRMRTVYLPIYEDNHPHQKAQKRGLRDALGRLGIVCEYDYVTRKHHGVDTHAEICALARAFSPHVLFTQMHRTDTFEERTIKQLRADNPDMLCLNWNGDVWEEVLLDRAVLELLSWYDLALVVNTNVLPEYERRGIPAAYWQTASEEPQELPEMPRHDVLFLGNCYSDGRRAFGQALKQLPYNVGIYGSGWGELGEGTTLYNFSASHALMKNATICIGDNAYQDAGGFTSNRLFETLYAGGFLLHQPMKNFAALTGIKAGKHYVEFTDVDDLARKVGYYMTHEAEREKIRRAGHRLALKEHTFDARVRELFTKLIPEKAGMRELA